MSSSKIEVTVDVHDEQIGETNPHKDEISETTDVNKEIKTQGPSVTVDPSDVNTAACQIKARVDVEEKQVETNPHMHKDEIFDSTDVNKEIPQSPSVTVDPSDVITAACQTPTDQASTHDQIVMLGPAARMKFWKSQKNGISNKKKSKTAQKNIKQCGKEKKELTKKFNIAMEKGLVTVKSKSVLIIGAAGVGKTCAKNLILDLPPPEVRNSTGTLERELPVRFIRDIDRERAQVNGSEWTKVKVRGGKDEIAAKSAFTFYNDISKKTNHERRLSRDKVAQFSTDPQNPICPTVFTSSPTSTQGLDSASSQLPQFLIEDIKEYVTDMMETDSSFAQDSEKVLGHDWIYFIDSGGQPQFHNLLPHFIQGLSTILIVIRLSEKLNVNPNVEYYENGASTGSHQSPLSIIDTLKCLIRSMQSYKISHQKPKLLFIGTFYDQITNSDSLTEKNQQLYDLFSEECLDQLVFSNSAKNELIFPINGKNPGEPEKEIACQIRLPIKTAQVQFENEIPIRWNMLEVFLEYISTYIQRKVLSRAECLKVAQELKFNISNSEDELTNALKHFHNMHLLHYYPQILPDVVFTSPQVILDELTALVKEVYRLRDSSGATIVVDHQLRRGIITTASLSKFQSHYVKDIFGPPELQTLFIGLLIITPISSSQDKNDHSNKKFFMPALLHMIPSADLEMYRVFEPIQPLLISFESGLPRSGVFCCLQVYLMKELKWKIVYTNTEPKIIAQNCVMLAHPREPCTITIIDSFSYIEAYVSSKPENYRRVLPLIRESILDGIKAANQALQYACRDEDQPRLTFFCPCHQEVSANPPQRHIGKVKEGNEIQCSVQQQSYFDLNEKHTKWLGPIISGKPLLPAGNILEREHLWHIHEAIFDVRSQWKNIGRALGVESSHLDSIHGNTSPHDDKGECLYQVLERWIRSGEATVTMNRLLEVLEGKVIGEKHLVNKIRAYKPEQKAKIGLD